MVRNSILYRRLWYFKRRNARVLNIYFKILVMLIVFAVVMLYVQTKLLPNLA